MCLSRLFSWVPTRAKLPDGPSCLPAKWDPYLDDRRGSEKLLRYDGSWSPPDPTSQEDRRRTSSRSHPQIFESRIPGKLALARNVEWSPSRFSALTIAVQCDAPRIRPVYGRNVGSQSALRARTCRQKSCLQSGESEDQPPQSSHRTRDRSRKTSNDAPT